MALYLWSYRRTSQSGIAIAEALGAKFLHRTIISPILEEDDEIINWGSTMCPYSNAINKSTAVTTACSKTRTYRALYQNNLNTCEYTLNSAEAKRWHNEGNIVYARTHDTGHAGQGIYPIVPNNSWESQRSHIPNTPEFYTKYILNDKEYRIYIVDGTVITINQKVAREGTDPNPLIRSHGDWKFVLTSLYDTNTVLAKLLAYSATKALGLDFAGVDVVIDNEGVPYILEINTAPGLKGPTNMAMFQAALKDLITKRYLEKQNRPLEPEEIQLALNF